MRGTRVVALLTEADITATAQNIAAIIKRVTYEGGEELDEDELVKIIEDGLHQLDASN